MTVTPRSLRSTERGSKRVANRGNLLLLDVACNLQVARRTCVAAGEKVLKVLRPVNTFKRYRKLIRQRALRKLGASSQTTRFYGFGRLPRYVSTSDGRLVSRLTIETRGTASMQLHRQAEVQRKGSDITAIKGRQ